MLENILIVICAVGALVACGLYRWTSENVRVKYIDRRVGGDANVL